MLLKVMAAVANVEDVAEMPTPLREGTKGRMRMRWAGVVEAVAEAKRIVCDAERWSR